MDVFWIVLRDKQGGTYISKRHESMEAARTEAERLCRKEGGRFYVMAVCGFYEPQETPVVWREPHNER